MTGFSLAELEAMCSELGVEPARLPSNGAAVEPVVVTAGEALPDPLPERVRELLCEDAVPGTRSERSMALVAACVRCGFTDGQVLSAALLHRPTRDRHRSDTSLLGDVGRCLAKARAAAAEVDAKLAEWAPTPDAETTEPGNPVLASLLDWPTFWATDRADHAWTVEPLLARGRGHAIWAAAKAGKSLVMLNVAARAAAGLPVLSRPAGDPLRVLYLDAEMSEDDVAERLEEMGLDGADLSALHYALLPALAPLDTLAGGAQLVEAALELGVELVCVDTLARTLVGEENSSDTLRAFARFTGLGLKRAGIGYVRLDHAGHDASTHARGSSAKADDVDVVWNLTATDDGVRLKRTHSRVSWIPERLDLARTELPLGFELASESYPVGTAELAVELDRLGVPVELGERTARQHAKAVDPDFTATGTVLRAAIRYRKMAGWEAS